MTSLLPRLLGSLTGSPAAWGPAAAACTRLPWPCTCNPTAAHHYTTSAASSSTPADAQQQQPQRAQPQPSLRSLKAKANLEYSRKRAAWRRQLGALRRQWLEEHQEAQHAAAAERQRDQEERQQLASLRASQKQLDHGQGQVQRAIRDAERHVEAAERRLQMAYRAKIRERIMERHKQHRHEQLLQKSRNWIPAELFEDRIKQAVDRPVSM